MIEEKRPLAYMSEILAKTITIDGVPKHLRSMVETHLKIRSGQINDRARVIMSVKAKTADKAKTQRRILLNETPEDIRYEVKARVDEMFQERLKNKQVKS